MDFLFVGFLIFVFHSFLLTNLLCLIDRFIFPASSESPDSHSGHSSHPPFSFVFQDVSGRCPDKTLDFVGTKLMSHHKLAHGRRQSMWSRRPMQSINATLDVLELWILHGIIWQKATVEHLLHLKCRRINYTRCLSRCIGDGRGTCGWAAFVVRFYKFSKMLHLDLLVVAKFIMKVDPDKLHAADQRDMMSELATSHRMKKSCHCEVLI